MADKKLRAQLVGATGYGGLGILELLLGHPNFEVAALIARDDAGRRIDHVYPHLTGRCAMTVEAPADPASGGIGSIGRDCDVVIFATPDRVSQQYAADLVARGVRFIDYSGDFRFTSTADYARYAERHPSIKESQHDAAALLGHNAYGVSELNAEAIAAAPMVGNPGCFAIGIILGMAPLYAGGLVQDGVVAVDGLTGSSGAGKKPAPTQHFSHLNDNVIPYRVLNHQHVVEAEMSLGRMGDASGATVDFIPHLLGTTRGILNTMHATLTRPIPRDALLTRCREFFDGHTFVRVLDAKVKKEQPAA